MLADALLLFLFIAAAYGVYYCGCQIYCILAGIPFKEFPIPFNNSRNDSDPPFGNALVKPNYPLPNLPGGAEARVQESNTCSQIP